MDLSIEKYIKEHNESGLKVGDRVKIVRSSNMGEGGWPEQWADNMFNMIDREGTIIDCKERVGFEVRPDGLGLMNDYWYPWFVLKKIEPKVKVKFQIVQFCGSNNIFDATTPIYGNPQYDNYSDAENAIINELPNGYYYQINKIYDKW